MGRKNLHAQVKVKNNKKKKSKTKENNFLKEMMVLFLYIQNFNYFKILFPHFHIHIMVIK